MKKISVLAFLTLLLMAVELVTAFTDMWGQTNPRTLIENRTEQALGPVEQSGRMMFAQTLNIVPDNDALALDSARNTQLDVQTPYVARQVVVGGWIPEWVSLFAFLTLPVFPLLIWGIVNFIKLLVSVFRHEIFTRKNARKLRIFVYTTNGALALIFLFDWLMYRIVASQTIIPGYTIGSYEFAMSWSDMFLMFLFTEIFALGVKLQEEQELTI